MSNYWLELEAQGKDRIQPIKKFVGKFQEASAFTTNRPYSREVLERPHPEVLDDLFPSPRPKAKLRRYGQSAAGPISSAKDLANYCRHLLQRKMIVATQESTEHLSEILEIEFGSSSSILDLIPEHITVETEGPSTLDLMQEYIATTRDLHCRDIEGSFFVGNFKSPSWTCPQCNQKKCKRLMLHEGRLVPCDPVLLDEDDACENCHCNTVEYSGDGIWEAEYRLKTRAEVHE